MHHHHFIGKIDHDKIIAEIAAVEKETTGHVRVWISPHKSADVFEAAQKRFAALGMGEAGEGNAVLIYIAPRARSFAVIGGDAAHKKFGDAFWSEIAGQLSADLKLGLMTNGLERAIRRIGGALAEHFPRKK